MTRLSLQSKLLVFLLFPVVLINGAFAYYGFVFARDTLIELWTRGANVQMQLVSDDMSQRLQQVFSAIDAMVRAELVPDGNVTRAFEVFNLLRLRGVKFVDIESQGWHFYDEPGYILHPELSVPSFGDLREGAVKVDPVIDFQIHADPEYDYVEIRAVVRSPKVSSTRYVVNMSFGSFVERISELGLWHGGKAVLITSSGRCLASMRPDDECHNRYIGTDEDSLEKKVLAAMKQTTTVTMFGEGRPPEMVMGCQKVAFTDWYICFMAPGCDVCKAMLEFRHQYVIVGLAALGVILTIVIMSTRSVTRAIRSVVQTAERIEEGDYDVEVDVDRGDEIGRLQLSFNKMAEGLRKTQLIQETFGRYIDRRVAEELLNSGGGLNLQGQERTVTILKSDLRGFTRITSNMEPSQVVRMLNRYLSRMIAVIEQYKGIIVDFYGDGILVFFDGSGEEIRERAGDAVRCAVRMQRELLELGRLNTNEGLPELVMGIGIHTGHVIVGNIGSETRAKYGVVGAEVNLSDRLQALASQGGILLSHSAYLLVADNVIVTRQIEASLKGIDGIQEVYEIDYKSRGAAHVCKTPASL